LYKLEAKKSTFLGNVIVLLTGTGIAQIVPILVAPFLSRLYTPEDFGVLALYLSILQILGSIINLRYEMAIVLPKSKRESLALVLIGLYVAIAGSILLFSIVSIFNNNITSILGNNKISPWLYVIPFNIFLIGFFNILNYYNTRIKQFKEIAKSNIVKSTANSCIQVLLGVFKFNSGLIIGQLFSSFLGNYSLSKTLYKEKEILKTFTRNELWSIAKRYRKFPIYSTWGTFLNTFSLNCSNFFINAIYTLSQLGYYSYGYKYLSLPVSLIGNSVSQVYVQKAAEERNEFGNCKDLFISTFKKLLFISLAIFSLLFFIVEDLFAFIFGEQWRIAGRFAKIMIPLVFIRFISTPLSTTITVFEHQKLALLCHSILFILTLLSPLLSYTLNLEIESFLYLNTWILFFYHVGLLLLIYNISLGKK